MANIMIRFYMTWCMMIVYVILFVVFVSQLMFYNKTELHK